MKLTLEQKKLLGKLEKRAIAENEPGFDSGRHIFEQLARKGLAERVEDDFGEYVWQIVEDA